MKPKRSLEYQSTLHSSISRWFMWFRKMGVVGEDYGGPLYCRSRILNPQEGSCVVRPSEVGQLEKKGMNLFSFILT